MNTNTENYPNPTDQIFEIRKGLSGKIRSSLLFKVICIVYGAIFQCIWKYIIHFPEYLMYRKSKFFKLNHPILKKTGVQSEKNDPYFTNFAKTLAAQLTPEMIQKAQANVDQQRARGETHYNYASSVEITAAMEEQIIDYILSDEVLSRAFSYFNFIPRLGSFHVKYGAISIYDKPLAAQMWHRDGEQYKSLECFLYLNDIDEGNGAFSTIDFNAVPFTSMVFPEKDDQGLPPGVRGRISDEEMDKFVEKNNQCTHIGPLGTAVFADTGSIYHKGNFCTKGTRLVLHCSFFGENTRERESALEISDCKDPNKIREKYSNDTIRSFVLSPFKNDFLMWFRFKTFIIAKRYIANYLLPKL